MTANNGIVVSEMVHFIFCSIFFFVFNQSDGLRSKKKKNFKFLPFSQPRNTNNKIISPKRCSIRKRDREKVKNCKQMKFMPSLAHFRLLWLLLLMITFSFIFFYRHQAIDYTTITSSFFYPISYFIRTFKNKINERIIFFFTSVKHLWPNRGSLWIFKFM